MKLGWIAVVLVVVAGFATVASIEGRDANTDVAQYSAASDASDTEMGGRFRCCKNDGQCGRGNVCAVEYCRCVPEGYNLTTVAP